MRRLLLPDFSGRIHLPFETRGRKKRLDHLYSAGLEASNVGRRGPSTGPLGSTVPLGGSLYPMTSGTAPFRWRPSPAPEAWPQLLPSRRPHARPRGRQAQYADAARLYAGEEPSGAGTRDLHVVGAALRIAFTHSV